MKVKTKRLLLKLIPYPVIFVVGGLMYSIVEFGLLNDSNVYPNSTNPYNPVNAFIWVSLMTLLLGIVLGLIEELGFKNRFKHLSFSLKLLVKTILYVAIIVLILLLFSFILISANTGRSIFDVEVARIVFDFLFSFGFISIIIFAGYIINIALFFTEIVDYLGIDIVGNFFSGKYSKPVFENRIFMFLDMKDSTTIAERIGHQSHHELINDYYCDMSNAIINTGGSVYQYVGDEIVVSWELEEGLKDSNCLKCFFLIQKSIEKNAEKYKSKFGTVPGFKAGLHCGEVTRGQVGNIKRDLLYIGDVLNATARIQALCNSLECTLLLSEPLKSQLPESNYKFIDMGEFELKGRVKHEKIYCIKDLARM